MPLPKLRNHKGKIALAPFLRYFVGAKKDGALLAQGRKWAAKIHPLFIFVALIEYLHLVFLAIPGDAFEEDVGKRDEKKFRVFAAWCVDYLQAALILLGAGRFASPGAVHEILQDANVMILVDYDFEEDDDDLQVQLDKVTAVKIEQAEEIAALTKLCEQRAERIKELEKAD